MSTKVERNYLEINSLKDLKKSKFSPDDCLIDLSDPADFQINKFFYIHLFFLYGNTYNFDCASPPIASTNYTIVFENSNCQLF